MIVKVPGEIKIGIYPYTLEAVKDLKLKQGSWGVTNLVTKEIRIDSNLPQIELNQTLIHEVLHIISANYQCALDEDNVERIANGLSEFLFDNLGIEFDWSGVEC